MTVLLSSVINGSVTVTEPSYDFLITNDGDVSTAGSWLKFWADNNDAALSGKTVAVRSGNYTTKTILDRHPLVPLSIVAETPANKPQINELKIDGSDGLWFEDIKIVSDRWQADADAFGALMIQGTIPGPISFTRCDFKGNYRGTVNPTFDLNADTYPEYACILPVFTGGVVSSLVIERNTVGDLMADGTYNLSFSNTANGTFSVAPVATFTVASGIITATTLTSGGASTFSDSAGKGVRSNIISWTGQRRFVKWLPFGVKGLTPTNLTGSFLFSGCTFDFLCNALKLANIKGSITVENCFFDRIYQDYFSTGHAGGANPHPTISFRFNTGTRPFSKLGDPGDPHSDWVQYFGVDTGGSQSSVNAVGSVFEGNVFWQGAARGTVQGFILADLPAGIYLDRWRVCGNLVVTDLLNLGIAFDTIQDCYVYRNTTVHFDATLGDNSSKYIGGIAIDSAGQSAFISNIAEAFQNNGEINVVSVGNVLLGANGGTIPYDTVFATPTAARTTLAEVLAAYTPESGYAGKGAVGGGYIDFTARTIDKSLEPTHMLFPDLMAQTVNTLVTSEWTCVKGGVAGRAITITGGEYRIASDRAGTGAGSWTSSAGTVNPNQYVQIRQTTSASGSTVTTATLTVGGTSFAFSATTVSTASFVRLDNQTSAYSRAAAPITTDTNIRKIVIAARVRPSTLVTNANLISTGNPSALRLSTPTTTTFRLALVGSTTVSLRPTLTATTAMRTHLITLDFTDTTPSSGCRWATDIDGVILNNTPGSGTFDTRSVAGTGSDYGARVITATNLDFHSGGGGLGICGEADGGGVLLDGDFEFFYMAWGTSGFTLPDITDPSVRALFTADKINLTDGSGPTGSQPQLFWTATDLTQANSGGGMPNRGSIGSMAMVKQAGTYA